MTNYDNQKLAYEELFAEIYSKSELAKLKNRLQRLSESFEGQLFLNLQHKNRFKTAKAKIPVTAPSNFVATIFLLTSSNLLWTIAKNKYDFGQLNFEEMKLAPMNLCEFATFFTAKSIYNGEKTMSASELQYDFLVDDETFKAITHAKIIAKIENVIKI